MDEEDAHPVKYNIIPWTAVPNPYENRRDFVAGEWEASCRADGCVDFDGIDHICDLEAFIFALCDLREKTIEAYRGTRGEEVWFDEKEREKREADHNLFRANLAMNYPDTYARVFGKER